MNSSNTIDPRVTATAELFARYLAVIEQNPEGEPETGDPRLSMANLAWMCREGQARAATAPLDKMSRWLGFVQGCLAMRGLCDVDAERDHSRPMFHDAYCQLGIEVPGKLEQPS